jgi:hypothetical protein
MTTLDDLRQALDDRAGTASDGAGIVEQARAGAERIRKRRARGLAAAVCLAAVAAAVIPAVVARRHADGPPPAAVTHYRGPGRLTVTLAADSKFGFARSSIGPVQLLSPFRKTDKYRLTCCAQVRVYDPGRYDARELQRGRRITVNGHPAFQGNTSFPIPGSAGGNPSGGPGAQPRSQQALTIGWEDASGAWVTVIGRGATPITPPDPAAMLDVAAAVRLTAPQKVLVPMHFPVIPGNLPITYTEVDEHDAVNGPQKAALGFGGNPRPIEPPDFPVHDVSTPLTITSWTANGSAPWIELLYGPVNTTVEGRPARYYERTEQDGGSVIVPPNGSVMLVEIGSCGIQVVVQDRTKITRADLDAMFTNATFDKCDSTKTWTRPLN